MRFRRTPIEIESPEQLGYSAIEHNLAESSFSDMTLADLGIPGELGDLLLQYGDHLGSERLRAAISSGAGGVLPENVLITPGAAAALFIVASTLVEPGAHVLVCAPNYATNLETPRAIGADVETIDLRFEESWQLDPARIATALRPDTRLVSITYPHNPTGSMISAEVLASLVGIVDRHPTARLLVDETYRELAYEATLPPAATLSERVVAVSSMSKTYGLPGLRIGWLTCRDSDLMETFLAAKEQIFITGAVLDEELAARVLERRAEILPTIRRTVGEHLDLVCEWIRDNEFFEWVEPRAGVVGFPRLRPAVPVDVDRFYRDLLETHGTYVGPGHWFDQDRRYFRLGFAWPTTDHLRSGLEALNLAARGAVSVRTR
jgi:aspartate/methionine/tyrosine aminotransferase